MKLISHRGNINGPNPELENSPSYILNALIQGYDVQVDITIKCHQGIITLWLGNEEKQYLTTLDFLKQRDKIICHAKTLDTLHYLLLNNIHCFFHDSDDATLTSKNYIWLYPGYYTITSKLSIMVLPECTNDSPEETANKLKEQYYGVCSSYIRIIKDLLQE